MGNQPSRLDEGAKTNTGQKLLQDESLVGGNRVDSYGSDSLTCQDSKSTFGTESMRPVKGRGKAFSQEQKGRLNVASTESNKSLRQSRDDKCPSSHISDDQVHVNLAMADLMAYLQVVANNSNNLPLTRRDDPELGRTVSNLTPDEYARKSAAFIPSDVRVIGGSFTRYGRVWDLPTSEEFNACDGAQEPGKSHCWISCSHWKLVVSVFADHVLSS